MRKRWLLAIILLLCAAGGWFRIPLTTWFQSITHHVARTIRPKPVPDPKRYAVIISELERWRRDLATRHKNAHTEAERSAIEHDARVILEHSLPEMMRCWIGTPWDFNGTAAKPGEGKIACGYFVATVLMDAGFQVDRYQLAQQASGNILRTFLDKNDCQLMVGKPYDTFTADFEKSERGIYLIGLDTHVGFLVSDGQNFHMLHSSGSRPWCVVDEEKTHAGVLQRSNWRMFGNLTAKPQVIRRWLKHEPITVHEK